MRIYILGGNFMTKTQVCAITSGISSIAITGIIGLVIVGFKISNKSLWVKK